MPELAAIGLYPQLQATAVRQFADLLAGLRGFDLKIRQWHGGIAQGGIREIPPTVPPNRAAANELK